MKVSQTLKAALMSACVVLASAPTVASAQVKRYISFENDCPYPVRIYISHADGWRNWHPHGPFVLDGNEGPIRLEADGVTLTQSDDHELYFYAERLDGNGVWDGEDHWATYNGIEYGMRKANVTVNGGWLNARLTCNN